VYDSCRFDKNTIARTAGHFQSLLESIVSNPDQRLKDLPLLTESERHQLLVEWNQTSTPYPREACISSLFQAQADQSPDAIALVLQDQHLPFAELNRQANRLARYLQSRGVGPDALVGICLERSLDMVISILGVLKAGAYVPLDPPIPQRLA
jgi:non-ribosomal peptide synthetase component F